MIILHDPGELDSVADPFFRALIALRFEALAEAGVADESQAEYVLVEAGDTVAALEAAAGIGITLSPISGLRYGDAGFVPCFELLEEHLGHGFEMVHILNDSGFAVTTLVPDCPGIDAELLRFCREFATPSPDRVPLPASREVYVPPA